MGKIFFIVLFVSSMSIMAGFGVGCGRATRRIKPGEFVVFNDSTTHWVMSNKTWRGAAIQLRKAV